MSADKTKKMKMRIRRGDNVVVISGRDKGKTGEVLRVDRVLRRRTGKRWRQPAGGWSTCRRGPGD